MEGVCLDGTSDLQVDLVKKYHVLAYNVTKRRGY